MRHIVRQRIRIIAGKTLFLDKKFPIYNYMEAKKYFNNTAYIIGKGPSLDYIDESYFPTNDPILCINGAFINIENLNIDNEIFGFQISTYRKDLIPKSGKMIIGYNLISSYERVEEKYCIQNTIVDHNQSKMSGSYAVTVCKNLGVKNVIMISFDGSVNGTFGYFKNCDRSFKDYDHLHHYKRLKEEVDNCGLNVKWVIPEQQEYRPYDKFGDFIKL